MLKILIVDDDEVDRMTVRRALRTFEVPIEFYETTTCAEAIALLQQDLQFDGVLLDYRLPDGDGLTFINRLRGAGFRLPIIVLTGQGDEELAVGLMKAGASDYLPKSKVSVDTLPRLLQTAIRLWRSQLETERAYQMLRETNELLTQQNEKLLEQQQKIQMQNLQLLEASRLKSEFLATMSHELRTPLNAIIGFSQILLRRSKNSLDAKQTDMVARILDNGRHLLELINDILDLSKIEAGRLELCSETCHLVALITNTVNELQSLAESKKIHLYVNFQVSSNIQIVNDPQRLRQILVNLLSNAIKFTEVGEVEVRVYEPTPEQIAIAIRDTGIGIANDNLKHIFEPFRQVDQTIYRKHAGTGLGLAITASLVQMMGGAITVESELGIGTLFCVIFPKIVRNLDQNLPERLKQVIQSKDPFQINQSSIQSSMQRPQ